MTERFGLEHEQVEVSVVIPTNGRWELLSRALTCVLAQEGVRVEALVVDDGSTRMPPASVMAQFRDPRVRHIRTEQRHGVAAARNRGISEACGGWLAFLDDDDVWAPTKLKSQLEAARRANADFAYSAAAILDERLHISQIMPAPSPERLKAEIHTFCAIPAGQSNVVVRSRLVRETGGFDERLLRVEDWELWIRLVARATGVACPEVHVGYVHHQSNMHLVETDLRREMEAIVRTYVADPTERRNALLLGARWRAHAHRRARRRWLAAQEYLRAAVMYRDPAMLVRVGAAVVGERILSRFQAPNPSIPITLPWLESLKDAMVQ
jgi:glycosyltransferase involved in cell wall biosynthesis